jgi:hypothetical protein
VVLIAEVGTKLPFDISQSRVIFFDHASLSSAGKAKEELKTQIEASLSGTPDNPISDGMRLAELQAGNVEEQTLAVVLDRLQRLSHTTELIEQRLRKAERRGRGRSTGLRAILDSDGQVAMRGEPVEPRGRPIEPPRVVARIVDVDDDGNPIQYEYVPRFDSDIPGDLSDEEKAEILAEAEEEQRRRNPLSDPHGDPEAG